MQWKKYICLPLIVIFFFLPRGEIYAGLMDIDLNDPPHGLFIDEWMEVYLSGAKVGYSHYSLMRTGDYIHSQMLTRMQFKRGAVTMNLNTDMSTIETISGQPRSFKMKMAMAGIPIVTEGQIANGKVSISTRQLGMTRQEEYDWSPGALMSWGLGRETILRGFDPDTSYTMKFYSPDVRLDKTVSSFIEVAGKEMVVHRGESQMASKLVTTVKLDMGDITTYTWIDASGNTIKSALQLGGMQMLMYSTDQVTALTDFVPADLFSFSLLPLNQSIPADAQAVVYRLSLAGGNDSPELFSGFSCQKILLNDNGEILLCVGDNDMDALSIDPSGANQSAYLASNSYMSTEDVELKRLADEIIKKSTHREDLANRLRQFASSYITNKTLSVGFATASEVARNPTGDCTEHAVFLAALGRICDIPSRVVSGLVYIPEYLGHENVLGYHMWTQFFLNSQWIDHDAALKTSSCSPKRIAVFASSLEDNTMADFTFALMDLIGQLKVGVEAIIE